MWLFDQNGFDNALRISHVIVAVMWVGLLWFFNFVQVPAYAEMDAAARNNALDKLTWRALWWFRWAAAATVVFGILIVAVLPKGYKVNGFWDTPSGVILLLGIIMGLTMAANVWMVIWPNQQIVIANARNVQAGGEANPEAPAPGGRMASRQNTIFPLPCSSHGGRRTLQRAHFDQTPGGAAGPYSSSALRPSGPSESAACAARGSVPKRRDRPRSTRSSWRTSRTRRQ
jgi:uncharacterized membrane protein